LLIGAMVIGAAIGLYRAARVPMTGMPELIALFHSFVGLAAVLVGWNGYLEVEAGDASGAGADIDPSLLGIHHAEVVIGVFIGAVTFTGSIVAWGKLSARFLSAPGAARQLEPRRAVAFAALTVWFVIAPTLGVLIAVTVSRCCWASTSSPRSAAGTCRWSCPCSTATPGGPRRRPASCSATTC
jgi:NAD(P) transhydrogenase subunit beta